MMAGAIASGFMIRSGELTSVTAIAKRQTEGVPFLYLTEFSDHRFRMKAAAAQRLRPQIAVVGSSRTMQWRSAMFRPYRFYNAGGVSYRQQDYLAMLEEFEVEAPAVVLFSLDFFTFSAAWDVNFEHASHGDLPPPRSPAFRQLLRNLTTRMLAEPLVLFQSFKDPLTHIPAVGLRAAATGEGVRIDGSHQYGGFIRADPAVDRDTPDLVLGRVRRGEAPFLFGRELDRSRMVLFEAFARRARARGITLVGVTMPFHPLVLAALQATDGYDNWREFRDPRTAEWMRSLEVLHFDFTELSSFGGREEEFADPFHPSEPAYARMLLVMMQNPRLQMLLREIDLEDIRTRLTFASPLEMYRNEF
jgi:hypothetical protein